MAVVVAVFHKMGVNDQVHVSAAVHLRKGSTVPKNKWVSRHTAGLGLTTKVIFVSMAVNRFQVFGQESIPFSQTHK